ncbi:MAG: septal ring lytic transglycosylase RlpA family protein [Pseudomonadota bacterium]
MKNYSLFVFFLFALPLIVVLTSCGTTSNQAPEYARKYQYEDDGLNDDSANPPPVKQAIPKKEPKSRYGNPKSYTVFGKRYFVLNSSKGYKQTGGASWYGKKFHGERTSNGERYDMYAMSAAHKTLPLPSYVKVTNLDNQRNVIVRINDRGPFHQGRIIDLSYTAAHQLGIVAKGTGRVEVEAIDVENWQRQQSHNTTAIKTPGLSSRPVATGTGLSYIQVGAFADNNNAQVLATKLGLLLKQPVSIVKKKIKTQWLNIVKIGPLSSKIVEKITLKQLLDRGYSTARIVK